MATKKPVEKKTAKTAPRMPTSVMRDKLRKATAPEAPAKPSTEPAPWDDAPMTTTTPTDAQPTAKIDEALSVLASIGITPETPAAQASAPAPVPVQAGFGQTPASTTMVGASFSPAPAPVQAAQYNANEPMAASEHPLFKSTPRPTYTPTPVSAPAQGVQQYTYASFSTPLGQSAGTWQPNKPEATPEPSKAFFASSSAPL